MVQVVDLTAVLPRPYDIKVQTYPEIWDAMDEVDKDTVEKCVADIASAIESTIASRVRRLESKNSTEPEGV